MEAGLSEPVRRAYGESADPTLVGIETHGADQPQRRELFAFEALVVEAERPAD